MARGDSVGDAMDSLAGDSSRRGFLARVSAGLMGVAFGGAIANALNQDADAYTNFCGHTYTTGNCIHPYGLPRIDSHGYPVRPSDGHAIDNTGRKLSLGGRGQLKELAIFFRMAWSVGLRRSWGWLWWKLLVQVLARNPGSIRFALWMATLYVHFASFSTHLVERLERRMVREEARERASLERPAG